ncbi:MAG: divalent-cation tolerance protein CutA [Chthoniobacterales bacterium]
MATHVLVALCTMPDADVAASIATDLVNTGLAACGNILPNVRSIYRWQGKVESADEVLVVFKLAAERYGDFEAKLRALHPYEVPEIIAFHVAEGLPEYLSWVRESCG